MPCHGATQANRSVFPPRMPRTRHTRTVRRVRRPPSSGSIVCSQRPAVMHAPRARLRATIAPAPAKFAWAGRRLDTHQVSCRDSLRNVHNLAWFSEYLCAGRQDGASPRCSRSRVEYAHTPRQPSFVAAARDRCARVAAAFDSGALPCLSHSASCLALPVDSRLARPGLRGFLLGIDAQPVGPFETTS